MGFVVVDVNCVIGIDVDIVRMIECVGSWIVFGVIVFVFGIGDDFDVMCFCVDLVYCVVFGVGELDVVCVI